MYKTICICLFIGCGVLFAQNNALEFNGSDDYVSIAANSAHEPASVTVEAWVKINGESSNQAGQTDIQFVIFKQNTRVNEFEGYTIYFFENTNHFEAAVSSSGGTQVHVTSSAVSLSEWNHVAMTANSTELKFYLNGILQGTAATGFSLNYGSNPLYFGRTGSSGWEGYFNGRIDDVRIWNIIRSQTEIQNNRNIELNGNEDGLAAYYKMSDGSGTTLSDNSSNSNAGTIFGASWVTNSDLSLPVELTFFTVENWNSGILLKWRTASEVENLGFILERKIVGAIHESSSDWSEIASYTNNKSLEGHGSTTEKHDYQYIDQMVQPGATYKYRLGDVDYSGKEIWHDAVEITIFADGMKIPAQFGLQNVYPNPFNPAVNLSYTLTKNGKTTLEIYNLRGQLVETLMKAEQIAGDYSITWRPVNLSTGIYLVRLSSGNQVNSQKVVFAK